MIDHILYASAALLALTSPLAELAFFLSATEHYVKRERFWAVLKVSFGVLCVLTVSALAGSRILALFGVSVAAFRAAGGLVVILAGLEMLRGAVSGITSVQGGPRDSEDHLWVPLVMPLIAGPASITAVITLALEDPSPGPLPAATLISVAAASLGVWAVLAGATWLSDRLSPRVVRIFERFFGLILLAVGFQMALEGIRQFFAAGSGTG